MRHHVAFVVNNYPPHSGGVERHVQSLARALVERGHRATVVTLSDTPGTAVENGVEVVRLRRWLPIASVLAFPLPGTSQRLGRLLREWSVTAVSIHTRFFPMSFLGLVAAREARLPVIHTEHGSGFVRGVSPLVALASRVVDWTIGRRVLRRSTVVLAVSDAVAAFVERLSGVRAELFPAAIDLEPWTDGRQQLNAHQAQATTARFVFLGRIVRGKGWDTVLKAVVLLHDRGLPARIDFIGDGPELAELRAQVEDVAASDLVGVHGHLSGEPLASALRGAILVNPSTLAEGFQTSLLETLAAGGRIVTFPVPGANDLRGDGAPVRIVDAPDVAHLADAMAEEAAHPLPPYPEGRLERWGWKARAADYERVLDRAVAAQT